MAKKAYVGEKSKTDKHTILLLHGETISDSSAYGDTITNNGVTMSDIAKFGNSLAFSSIVSGFSVNLPVNLKSSDFTIDWWEYRNSADGTHSTVCTFGGLGTRSCLISYHYSTEILIYASSDGSNWNIANAIKMGNFIPEQWVHRAVVRSSGTIYLFENGNLVNTITGAATINIPNNILTFSRCFDTGYFNGYIDEFRVSNIARWTENFTPPVQPHTITDDTEVARDIIKIYPEKDGVARNAIAGWIGVSAIARQFWDKGNRFLGDIAIGQTVYMNVNGVSREFIKVNQGRPSTLYDSSCDDTWLLLKDIYTTRAWDSANNDYANSDIHSYLNGTFFNLFDAGIKNIIKQVKIPYHKGTGSGGSVASGSNGLTTKIFLLGGYEIGWKAGSPGNLPIDGACLDYFEGLPLSDPQKIAYYNGTATDWWLRSPENVSTSHVHRIMSDGGYMVGLSKYSDIKGIRPCFILPSTQLVDSSFNVIA